MGMRLQRVPEPKLCTIISAPLVGWLRQQNYPMRQPPIRFYPDGSLWAEYRDIAGFERFIDRRTGLHTSIRFRPLSAFGGDEDPMPSYLVYYPGECTWMGECEIGVLMYPSICTAPTPEEIALDHVHVRVELRRKLTTELSEELAGVLRQWFEEVGSKGVFGEAGVASMSPVMRYLDRCAGFELDARGSGQETLNTLYVALLNWAMNRRRPLVMTHLAADPSDPVFSSDSSVRLR